MGERIAMPNATNRPSFARLLPPVVEPDPAVSDQPVADVITSIINDALTDDKGFPVASGEAFDRVDHGAAKHNWRFHSAKIRLKRFLLRLQTILPVMTKLSTRFDAFL
jgi:hypothetical protein